SSANPPGFDQELLRLMVGDRKTFVVHYPADYAIADLAGVDVTYDVQVTALKRRVVPALDDEFAKDLGEFDTLDALKTRIREDLTREAEGTADREIRAELLKQLAARVPFELPQGLVAREVERRAEELARRLFEQGIDPRQAQIDWAAFREAQTEAAREAVGGMLVLDEIARREQVTVSDEDVDAEITRYAEAAGRTPAAMRAAVEKEGGISRLQTGLRREKAIDLALSRAT